MNRFICWLKTIWYSWPNVLRGSFPVSGHSYYETYDGKDVQILKCKDCGDYSVGYEGGEPEPPEGMDE